MGGKKGTFSKIHAGNFVCKSFHLLGRTSIEILSLFNPSGLVQKVVERKCSIWKWRSVSSGCYKSLIAARATSWFSFLHILRQKLWSSEVHFRYQRDAAREFAPAHHLLHNETAVVFEFPSSSLSPPHSRGLNQKASPWFLSAASLLSTRAAVCWNPSVMLRDIFCINSSSVISHHALSPHIDGYRGASLPCNLRSLFSPFQCVWWTQAWGIDS